MHPGLLRVFMGFSVISADILFLIVIITVGKEDPDNSYLCKENAKVNKSMNATVTKKGTCWNWHFNSKDGTCMFVVLFAATICLHLVIFIFFTAAFLKCLFPEFALLSQRSLVCRCIGRYLSVALSFAACIMASALLVFVSVHDSSSSSSCYDSGHLWRNCQDDHATCWVFSILLVGCLFSFAATFLSACQARLMYIGRRDFEEQERIYQSYVDYNAIKDLDSF